MNKSRQRSAGLYVEIKQPAAHRKRGLDPSKEVLRILKHYGYESTEDRVFVQCFEADEVLRLRTELNCRLPLIQLHSGDLTTDEIAEISRVADGIGINLAGVVRFPNGQPPQVSKLVETAHQHSLLVHVWTFRTDDLPEHAESPNAVLNLLVQKAGVDGIFTDQPDSVLSWRQAALKVGAIRGPFHLLNGGGKSP
ncbi:MAG: glycerophosphodiester phosphodiesterase family protein [Planctomycetaceae bacterium]